MRKIWYQYSFDGEQYWWAAFEGWNIRYRDVSGLELKLNLVDPPPDHWFDEDTKYGPDGPMMYLRLPQDVEKRYVEGKVKSVGPFAFDVWLHILKDKVYED